AVSLRDRVLGDSDVLALRGLLDLLAGETAGTREQARTALSIDQTHVLARLVDAHATGSIAPEAARATAAAHPDDWRVLLRGRRAVRGTPAAAQVRSRLCALAPGVIPECEQAPASR